MIKIKINFKLTIVKKRDKKYNQMIVKIIIYKRKAK